MTFGEKIQKLRKEAGLSQEELSYQLGVSRQAISKWERDNGYPETEKIVRMSKLFNVSFDYLLNEEDTKKPEINPDKKGIYVSREMADGFLAYQKRKMIKVGVAIGLFVGGLSLSFWDAEMSMTLFMAVVILGIIILFSVKLADNSHGKLWKRPLLFDKTVKTELNTAYAEKKKFLQLFNLIGIALIALGFLFFPLIASAELLFADTIALVAILTLLCGCQANKNTNSADYGDAISKAQEIAVISPDTAEVIETITDAKEIGDFVSALNLDQWELRMLPDEASEIGAFGLAQKKTIKLGQTDTDGTLYDVTTITLYNGSYIGIEICGLGGLDMTFAVSEDTADYLNGYFE